MKQKKEKQKLTFKSVMKEIISTGLTFVITMGVYHVLFTYVLDRSVVEGDSMVPTLHNDDFLISSRVFDIDPEDIVIINSTKLDKRIVKRVIATAGQKVDIDFENGLVFVDDQPLNEQLYNKGEKLVADYYVNTLTTVDMGAFSSYPMVVPEGYIFVLGDNRNISLDSKSNRLGLVPVSEVKSQVIVKCKPINDFTIF